MMDSWDGDDNDDVDCDSYDDHVDIDDDKDDHGNDFDNKKQREGHGMLPTCESHQIPIIMSVWELATKRQLLTQLWQNCQMLMELHAQKLWQHETCLKGEKIAPFSWTTNLLMIFMGMMMIV